MNLLDRNSNAAILLAGIFALIVGVGAARFAFTSLLPSMLTDTLTLTFSGVLASVNYLGYLSGSIVSIVIKTNHSKVRLFRIGTVLCVLTTFILATTTHEVVWLVSRVIAGFGSAMSLVVGSAIVMSKLNMTDKTKAMGIHFSGIGFSILITDLLSRLVFWVGGTWAQAWLAIAIVVALMTCYSIYILSFDDAKNQKSTATAIDMRMFTGFVLILIFAYFTEGLGMVVQGTFLPDIVNSLEGLQGFGGYAWTLVGVAGIPSCILWMRAAHKYGSINIIVVTMGLQVVGMLIPVFTNNIYLNLLAGILFGGTFIALVALFMTLGGKLAGDKPVVLMGAITTAYGIGQVAGPLYSVALTDYFGSYNAALLLTAAMVTLGAVLMFMNRNVLVGK
ncbi:YbfB/YjiJ family MFS transporter [Reinekea forsetii]|nr:YbfB/YjiJ family MFS transporter [Reinekea forsetii]